MLPNIKAVAGVAAATAGFVILFSFMFFIMSIFPAKFYSSSTPGDYGLEYEEVQFTTEDGKVLAGWFIPSSNGTNRTIIAGHGYPFDKGNVLGYVLFLQDEFNIFLFDFRSFGESEGRMTTAGLRETRDVNAAVNYLQGRGDSTSIGALGFSLSGAAFLMADNEGIDAVVSDSSYASLGTLLEDVYSLFGPFRRPFLWMTSTYSWTFFGAVPSDVSPMDSIKGMNVPVLLIHGERDSQIPVRHAYMIYENSDKNLTELWIVAGADHGFSQAINEQEYHQRVAGFFRTHL